MVRIVWRGTRAGVCTHVTAPTAALLADEYKQSGRVRVLSRKVVLLIELLVEHAMVAWGLPAWLEGHGEEAVFSQSPTQ